MTAGDGLRISECLEKAAPFEEEPLVEEVGSLSPVYLFELVLGLYCAHCDVAQSVNEHRQLADSCLCTHQLTLPHRDWRGRSIGEGKRLGWRLSLL